MTYFDSSVKQFNLLVLRSKRLHFRIFFKAYLQYLSVKHPKKFESYSKSIDFTFRKKKTTPNQNKTEKLICSVLSYSILHLQIIKFIQRNCCNQILIYLSMHRSVYTHGAHISSFSILMTIYCASRSSQDHKQFKAAFCLNGSLIMRKHDIYM